MILLQNNFKDKVISDLKDKNYIYRTKKEDFNVTEFMQVVGVRIILTSLIIMPSIAKNSRFGSLLFLTCILASFSAGIYQTIENRMNPIIRTKKALELSSKLNGLKNFLLDFTQIGDRKTEEIKIFDDSILYAVIFDIKGILNDESKKIYSKLKEQVERIIDAKHN